LYGLGGCGKSALAIELAYRVLARDARYLILWVPAISRESFELAYRQIGVQLSVRGITEGNADIKQLVIDALSSKSGRDWLMIVDNADDPEVLTTGAGGDARASRLMDYLPTSGRGKIIFTTRNRKATGSLTPGSVLELPDMSKAEARKLLTLRIANYAMLTDTKAVDELLELLAYLPLAIVQAVAFIDLNDISVSEYISLFQSTETELLGEHFEDPSRYREIDSTIARTWHISFNQIRRVDPLAADYLSFMACISRTEIPQSLLLLPPSGSLVQQAKALGTLKGYALITERQQPSVGEKFFDIHRLVYRASVWWLESYGERAGWTAKVAARLEELVPYGGHEKKDVWMAYLSHAIHVAGLGSGLDETTRLRLLDRVGRCQASLGQYSTAERTHRQVLLLREKSMGKEDIQTLTSMNELGRALDNQGRYLEAEATYRQTLAGSEKILGAEHPFTLTSISNLALVLSMQGKYAEAEEIDRQTLARREKVFGTDHPDTLTSMSNLALVLDRQGKYAEAEGINRQTLAGSEKILGAEHPFTLTSISNLALVLSRQGKYVEAEGINRQTLAGYEKVLGADHPDTLTSLSRLAFVLDRQDKYAEAEEINRQTLAGYEKVLGTEHHFTLTSVYCLAHLLSKQHRYKEAGPLYQRACAGYKIVLGPDHPDTRACQQHYSEMIEAQEQHH
jgi:tetratricopeptide (TPR) repeat protein